MTFTQKNEKNRSLSHPLGHLGVTYALHLLLVGKPVVDFIFVVIEHFRYLLRLRRYERKSVEVGVFRTGWVTLSAAFRGSGASPTNRCWYQSSRVTALSCGIKISAVRHLVLSQSTRATDGRTHRRTDRITTPKTALAYARAVKTLDLGLYFVERHARCKISTRKLEHVHRTLQNFFPKSFSHSMHTGWSRN